MIASDRQNWRLKILSDVALLERQLSRLFKSHCSLRDCVTLHESLQEWWLIKMSVLAFLHRQKI
jgi:hypothetical protein